MGYLQGQDVLKNINLTLKRGSFTFISGPSGAGKSSLLSLLALIQKPTRGKITMFGQDMSGFGRDDYARMRRRIGTVFQDYRLLPYLTVEENVALPLKIAGEPQAMINDKVKELLHWVGLGHFHKAKPNVLSGGQQQRVAIARAIITKPDLLVADEPSGNLDAELSLKFMYLFEALNKSGTTVVFATHDEFLLSRFGHTVLHMKDGRLEEASPRVKKAAAVSEPAL
jgi:cell division transport system ATP-binding protein